jgi:hypothetical protein
MVSREEWVSTGCPKSGILVILTHNYARLKLLDNPQIIH